MNSSPGELVRVVLADDEPFTRSSLMQFVPWREHKCQIINAYKNGSEVLRHLAKDAPDLIITDIRMPHMDGIELMHAVRETDDRTRFIVVSGYRDFEYAKAAM